MTAGLVRGERAPDMVLPAADGTPTRYYAHAGGRPTLLVFADAEAAGEVSALASGLGDVLGSRLTAHAVGPAELAATAHGLPVLTDADGRAAEAYRTGGAATAFVLNANLRVRATFPLTDGRAVAAGVRELVDELEWDEDTARVVVTQAPLLVVPEVLDPEQCAELMRVWEEEGSDATGVEATADGRRAEQVTGALKRRRDHIVRDAERSRELSRSVGRRVMPELSRAFAYRATRFEGFKIACYEASDGGHFRAHRDNLSPSTAHRRFALTLNLNDDYEGGQLRFPEFGPDLFRPPSGGALLFSCSHLHEVLPVTRGRRFVLLSFLFGDESRPAP